MVLREMQNCYSDYGNKLQVNHIAHYKLLIQFSLLAGMTTLFIIFIIFILLFHMTVFMLIVNYNFLHILH